MRLLLSSFILRALSFCCLIKLSRFVTSFSIVWYRFYKDWRNNQRALNTYNFTTSGQTFAYFDNVLDWLGLFQRDIELLALLYNELNFAFSRFASLKSINIGKAEDFFSFIHVDEVGHILFSNYAHYRILLILVHNHFEQVHVLWSEQWHFKTIN